MGWPGAALGSLAAQSAGRAIVAPARSASSSRAERWGIHSHGGWRRLEGGSWRPRPAVAHGWCRQWLASLLGGGAAPAAVSALRVDAPTGVIARALEDERYRGAFNVVAPQRATQREFARTLAQVLRRPLLLRAPAPALRLLMGEMSTLLLTDQEIAPARLAEQGYRFGHPELAGALEQALAAGGP